MNVWAAAASIVALMAQVDRSVAPQTLALVDDARHRPVPVAVYVDVAASTPPRKLAIISHGYGGRNTDYGFIASYLATHGYYVASIQHEVAGDDPLPTTGNPYDTRKPSWERGVQNILFVVRELKRRRPELDDRHLLLVGHSHGGDTTMLFAREHPELVDAVISLDNRRMPLPRGRRPRILSLRSSDQQADPGVLPSAAEQEAFGIAVVRLPATIHDEMWDGATDAQKREMLRHIDAFLR
jgi:predicted dienelactone hydrolase